MNSDIAKQAADADARASLRLSGQELFGQKKICSIFLITTYGNGKPPAEVDMKIGKRFTNRPFSNYSFYRSYRILFVRNKMFHGPFIRPRWSPSPHELK